MMSYLSIAALFIITIYGQDDDPFCDNTSDCASGEICITISPDGNGALGPDDFGICFPSADTPFCESSNTCDISVFGDDAEDFEAFKGLGLGCQPITATLPNDFGDGVTYTMEIGMCFFNSQCSADSQCLEGSECLILDDILAQELDSDSLENIDFFDFGVCNPVNTTCASAADCGGDLECEETSNLCYLPCTSNSDCKNDAVTNWACGNPADVLGDVDTCVPIGISGTVWASGSDPTTEAPAGSDMASVLAIFSGMVIMITNYLFM